MKIQTSWITVVLVWLLASLAAAGPYPPAAGTDGSTAIGLNDPNISGWATGYFNYFPGPECDIEWQTPEKATGPAQGIVQGNHDIVSLGRGGTITMVFDGGIGDGDGFDFAVFENGVNDYFLELGFVRVSSDGENFYGFYCDSLTAGAVGAYGIVYPTDVNGLGGKYRHGYGTPFDLAELRGVSPYLDVDNVRYVQIVDIVGDGGDLDTSGKPIYDPYPTIGSAGFDLDAIGVINLRTADINRSATVDAADVMLFARAWLAVAGGENWNGRCDLAHPKNGVVDIRDFAVLAAQWAAD